MSIPLEVVGEGKRWDLIRHDERQNFVYVMIDRKEETMGWS
jgi:hypothetical protein